MCIYIYIYPLSPLCIQVLMNSKAALTSWQEDAGMNVGLHVSFQISVLFFFFRYIPRNGISRLYYMLYFSFLRNLHNVFHSDCRNLHSYQEEFPFLHILANICCAYIFLMTAILMGVMWHLILVLIYISLIICNVDH